MLLPDFNFEKSLLSQNCRFLLGIDEVGRGPWAGPVTLGAFLLDLQSFDPQMFQNLKVRDSKKLSEKQRQKIVLEFKKLGFQFSTYSSSSQDIDQQGIATRLQDLITQALVHYRSQFDCCLIDGNYKITPALSREGGGGRVCSVVKGDSSCFSMAAASIVAKVYRDNEMANLHRLYPQYGFDQHKGYGTKMHLQALRAHGPCPHHRFSFKPISKLVLDK